MCVGVGVGEMEERRKFERRDLEDISAKLYRASDGVEIDFCPLNVSQQGISILTSVAVPPGEHLILGLSVKDVYLVVKWCRGKDDDPAVFRCGLETLESADHLDELIRKELSFE